MDTAKTLAAYGLFDARVPRYTSYPPANRFAPELGQQHQRDWLTAVPADKPISVYIHIPFCRRLCWFCACRTQGTQTLAPVAAYLADLAKEIAAVAAILPRGVGMARLHLGGGTPTLLSGPQMSRLLAQVFATFPAAPDFEFSVEIDPTEAADPVLAVLQDWGLHRASIGVQDFAPHVQKAIGREQSYDQTRAVIDKLRQGNLRSLNLDLIYGLPHQTHESLLRTLDQVRDLRPDRLALYGYAHVPHMSKRQVMIPDDSLPDALWRHQAIGLAQDRLRGAGYTMIGIDHFALPDDGLARAAASGRLRRNFQGYTDDPCETLIGLGASAISQFRDGFVQNAVATAAYRARASEEGLAGHKGAVLSPQEHFISAVINGIMCAASIDTQALRKAFPAMDRALTEIIDSLVARFPAAWVEVGDVWRVQPGFLPLTRVLAAAVDTALMREDRHSIAI